jgi:type II secretory pathway component PulJ
MKKHLFFNLKHSSGFSIVEVIISLAIFATILITLLTVLFAMSSSNSKIEADRDLQENGQKILDYMLYEIRSAKAIYTPTTTATQLSLVTSNYQPTTYANWAVQESSTYIDFFLCNNNGLQTVCVKKEGLTGYLIGSPTITVTSLNFSQVNVNGVPSIKVDMVVNRLITGSKLGFSGSSSSYSSSISLSGIASMRGY